MAKALSGQRRNWIIDFISRADTGISDAKVSSIRVAPQEDQECNAAIFFSDIVTEDLDSSSSDIEKEEIRKKFDEAQLFARKQVRLGHQTSEGEPAYLPWKDESAGTRKLMGLLVRAGDVLASGDVLVIDEMNSSLHTLLVLRLLELFKSPTLNPNGAQLLFTTHDTNILCSGMLRRDEIYFTEKNKSGETIVFQLADFPVRKDDNFEKGYLKGKFGAIPFFGDMSSISD